MSYEVIIDLSDVEHRSFDFKRMFNESIPCKERIVRCRDCLSWLNGNCYKHAYNVTDDEGYDHEEGVIPMDANDFCSLGTRREES